MKKYEKPRLIALSLMANDQLCQACQIDSKGDNADPGWLKFIGMFPGALDDTGCDPIVEDYCKHVSVTNVIVNS